MNIVGEWKKRPPREPMTTLAALVRDFVWRFPRERRDTVITLCAAADTFEEAVWLATNSIGETGKMWSHQVKVRRTSRDEFARLIIRDQDIIDKWCGDFWELHMHLDKIRPWGIGELTAYDVAVRIGAYLGMEPHLLYLHTGVMEGWLALIRRFPERRFSENHYRILKAVDASDLYPPLLTVSIDDAEDFICTYRSVFCDLEGIE